VTFRVAVITDGGVAGWHDTFDGVDAARAAVAEAGAEFPGADLDVQELVPVRGRLVWRSVDAPAPRQGFLARLFRS
jgi:hypothetical protein